MWHEIITYTTTLLPQYAASSSKVVHTILSYLQYINILTHMRLIMMNDCFNTPLCKKIPSSYKNINAG